MLPQHLNEVKGVKAQEQDKLVFTLSVIAGSLGKEGTERSWLHLLPCFAMGEGRGPKLPLHSKYELPARHTTEILHVTIKTLSRYLTNTGKSLTNLFPPS